MRVGISLLILGWLAAAVWAADNTTVPVSGAATDGTNAAVATQPVRTPSTVNNSTAKSIGVPIGAKSTPAATATPVPVRSAGSNSGGAGGTAGQGGGATGPTTVESKKPEFSVMSTDNGAPEAAPGGHGVVHTATTPAPGKSAPPAATLPTEWKPMATCAVEEGKAASLTGADYVRSVEVSNGSVRVTLENGGKESIRPVYEVRLLDASGTAVGRVRETGSGAVLAPGAKRVTTSRIAAGKTVASAEAVAVR